jgi:hypothetical protein
MLCQKYKKKNFSHSKNKIKEQFIPPPKEDGGILAYKLLKNFFVFDKGTNIF